MGRHPQGTHRFMCRNLAFAFGSANETGFGIADREVVPGPGRGDALPSEGIAESTPQRLAGGQDHRRRLPGEARPRAAVDDSALLDRPDHLAQM